MSATLSELGRRTGAMFHADTGTWRRDLTRQMQERPGLSLLAVAVGAMALGAFAAIAQTNLKRLMAYSSISHVGYALIGLAVGNQTGVRGVLVYFAIYLFMNLGTFALNRVSLRNRAA